MKSIVLGVIAIVGVAVIYINKVIKSDNTLSHIEDEDFFDKTTIKYWMNSLDLPEIDSSYRFFVIKVDRNNLSKLHIPQSDKLKLKNISTNKILIALVASNSNLDTKASTVYVCNSISPDLSLDNEVTELHLKY